MAESDNSALEDARKRARRRLVGAVVLALAAAVVLPLFLESDPKPLGPDVQIQIPAIDDAKFQNRLTPGGSAKAPIPDKATALVADVVKDNWPVPAAPAVASDTSTLKAQAPAAAPAETKVEQTPADTKPTETKAAEPKPAPASVAAPVTAAKKQASTSNAEPPAGTGANKTASATPKKAPATGAIATAPATPTTATPDTPKNGATPAAALPAFSLTATVPAPGAAAATDQKTPTTATPATPGTFVVQLGAFVDATVAGELAAKAGTQGFSAFLEPVTTNSGQVQRVRVGPFATRAEADAAEAKLKSAGFTAVTRPR